MNQCTTKLSPRATPCTMCCGFPLSVTTLFSVQLLEVRRAFFDVIPEQYLSIFDHQEFLMLLNGHQRFGVVSDVSL